MKFELLNGSYRGQDGTKYKAGETVTTNTPLDERFKKKFKKIGSRRAVEEKESVPEEDSEPKEKVSDNKFEIVPDGKRFNVIRVFDGQKINDKTLTKPQAEKLAGK